jgi:hypothetical protein
MPQECLELLRLGESHIPKTWYRNHDARPHIKRGKNLSTELLLKDFSTSSSLRTHSRASSSLQKRVDTNQAGDDLIHRLLRRKDFRRRLQTNVFEKSLDHIHTAPVNSQGNEHDLKVCIEMQHFLKGEIRIRTKQAERTPSGIKWKLWMIWEKINGRDVDLNYTNLKWPFNRKIRKRDPIKDKMARKLRAQQYNNTYMLGVDPGERPATFVPSLVRKPGSRPAPPRRAPKIRSPSATSLQRECIKTTENGLRLDGTVGELDTLLFLENPNVVHGDSQNRIANKRWREQSDSYLASQGRHQFNNKRIGRAPPVSKERLRQHLRKISYKSKITACRPAEEAPDLPHIKGVKAYDFAYEAKSSQSASSGELLDPLPIPWGQRQVPSDEVNHNGIERTTIWDSKPSPWSDTPKLVPETQSISRAGKIVVSFMNGTIGGVLRRYTPMDDEGIDISDEAVEMHNKNTLIEKNDNKNGVPVNTAANPADIWRDEVVPRRSFEQVNRNSTKSPITEPFTLFSKDTGTPGAHFNSNKTTDKDKFTPNTKLRKLSLSIQASPDTFSHSHCLDLHPKGTPGQRSSRSKSLRGRFPVVPSPSIGGSSPTISPPVTPGLPGGILKQPIPMCTVTYRTPSSTPSSGVASNVPICSPTAFSLSEPDCPLIRQPSTDDSDRQYNQQLAIAKRSRWRQSDRRRGLQQGQPPSPSLTESPSQAALTRRREKQLLAFETKKERSELANDPEFDQKTGRTQGVDFARHREVLRIEPLGGPRAQLIRRDVPSKRRRAGAPDNSRADSSQHCTIKEAHCGGDGEDLGCEVSVS